MVLGIGNHGPEYEATRHNVGFAVVDLLAARFGITISQKRWSSLAGDARVGGRTVWLLKPQTYVNRSGAAGQGALAFLKIPPAQLLVVVDDIHLPVGDLRLRSDGSAGGHNGLKDLIACLGPAFPRLRLGVGSPRPGADQISHVLGRFAPDERDDAAGMIAKAADAVQAWIQGGATAAARFNGPLRPPPPKPPKPPKVVPPETGIAPPPAP